MPSASPSREDLQRLFEAAYHARFRVELPTIRANLVNLNVSVIGERPALDLSRLIDPRGGGRWRNLPRTEGLVRRLARDAGLLAGSSFSEDRPARPAIIEQMDTTIVVDPGARVGQDADGNLIIEVTE